MAGFLAPQISEIGAVPIGPSAPPSTAPFGDLLSGNFIDRAQKRETGTREGIPSSA